MDCSYKPRFKCSFCQSFIYCSQECFDASNHPSLCSILEKYKRMRDWTWDQHKGDAAFFAFRKEFVDTLIQHVLEKTNCTLADCSITAVGSTSLTSDYDVTVSGPRAAQVVELFNQEFGQFFNGKSSATVFDTNLYGAGFLEPIQLGNFAIYGRFKYVTDAQDVKRQRTWALLQVYRVLVEKKDSVLQGNLLFKDAAQLYLELNRTKTKDRVGLNAEYEKALKVVEKIKTKMLSETTPNIPLRQQYKDAISRANYFAAEAYYTQGAFMHIVGQTQGKMKDIPITREEYTDSFIENIGYALEHDGKDVKYVARAMDALVKRGDGGDAEKRLFEVAEAMRINVRGKPKCGEKTTTECVLPRKAAELQTQYNLALRAGRGKKESDEYILKSILLKWTN